MRHYPKTSFTCERCGKVVVGEFGGTKRFCDTCNKEIRNEKQRKKHEKNRRNIGKPIKEDIYNRFEELIRSYFAEVGERDIFVAKDIWWWITNEKKERPYDFDDRHLLYYVSLTIRNRFKEYEKDGRFYVRIKHKH